MNACGQPPKQYSDVSIYIVVGMQWVALCPGPTACHIGGSLSLPPKNEHAKKTRVKKKQEYFHC